VRLRVKDVELGQEGSDRAESSKIVDLFWRTIGLEGACEAVMQLIRINGNMAIMLVIFMISYAQRHKSRAAFTPYRGFF